MEAWPDLQNQGPDTGADWVSKWQLSTRKDQFLKCHFIRGLKGGEAGLLRLSNIETHGLLCQPTIHAYVVSKTTSYFVCLWNHVHLCRSMVHLIQTWPHVLCTCTCSISHVGSRVEVFQPVYNFNLRLKIFLSLIRHEIENFQDNIYFINFTIY